MSRCCLTTTLALTLRWTGVLLILTFKDDGFIGFERLELDSEVSPFCCSWVGQLNLELCSSLPFVLSVCLHLFVDHWPVLFICSLSVCAKEHLLLCLDQMDSFSIKHLYHLIHQFLFVNWKHAQRACHRIKSYLHPWQSFDQTCSWISSQATSVILPTKATNSKLHRWFSTQSEQS